MKTIVCCPICRKQHEWSADNPWRPFCSDRCRLIDLGAWLEEKRAIPAEGDAEPDPEIAVEEQRAAH